MISIEIKNYTSPRNFSHQWCEIFKLIIVVAEMRHQLREAVITTCCVILRRRSSQSVIRNGHPRSGHHTKCVIHAVVIATPLRQEIPLQSLFFRFNLNNSSRIGMLLSLDKFGSSVSHSLAMLRAAAIICWSFTMSAMRNCKTPL